MKNKSLFTIVVAVLVATAIAFYCGMKYQQTKATFSRGQFQGNRQTGPGGQGRFGNMSGVVMGEIISQDDNSITVKLEDGTSKIVLLSDSVTISKTDTATKSDLKTGVKVGIFGTPNSDGIIIASAVQLNPAFRMGQRKISSPSPK